MSYTGWKIDQFEKEVRNFVKLAYEAGIEGRSVVGILTDVAAEEKFGMAVKEIVAPLWPADL
jgi:hypothetical protein